MENRNLKFWIRIDILILKSKIQNGVEYNPPTRKRGGWMETPIVSKPSRRQPFLTQKKLKVEETSDWKCQRKKQKTLKIRDTPFV